MKYSHIAFDVDGTLINTEYAILHSLQDTMRTLYAEDIPIAKLTFALGITGADALKTLGVKEIPKTIDLWNQTMDNYAHTITVFDGITEVLEGLLRLHCEIGIITSKTSEELAHDFSKFNISRYFNTIVCADDTKRHKPSAAPLIKYRELSETDGNHILYVGDSRYDSLCAQNAGVDFALAVWGSNCRTISADYYLDKPADLFAVVSAP